MVSCYNPSCRSLLSAALLILLGTAAWALVVRLNLLLRGGDSRGTGLSEVALERLGILKFLELVVFDVLGN